MTHGHICDCGRRYSNLDALLACQNANHGIPTGEPPSVVDLLMRIAKGVERIANVLDRMS